jgi:hypothetical protein
MYVFFDFSHLAQFCSNLLRQSVIWSLLDDWSKPRAIAIIPKQSSRHP